jgi:hypothetical protein
VIDEGDALSFRKGRATDRIAPSNIINVNHMVSSPERVTLRLRHPSAFGEKISFMPPMRFWVFSAHPIVEDLIRRTDTARRKARS